MKLLNKVTIIFLSLMLLASIWLVAGCGDDEKDTSEIQVFKDGVVINCQVKDMAARK